MQSLYIRRLKLAEIGALFICVISIVINWFLPQYSVILKSGFIFLSLLYFFGGVYVFTDGITKYNNKLLGVLSGVSAAFFLIMFMGRITRSFLNPGYTKFCMVFLFGMVAIVSVLKFFDKEVSHTGFYNNLVMRLMGIGILYAVIGYLYTGKLWW